ncbi:unnamed protein product [Diamesa hyperborea]
MYPNPYPSGQPSYPGSQPSYPGQQQYGAQPFGSGYPPMNQPGYPGMPQQGMPQQGMPQPGMPQPGMPQQGAFPPMNQASYPGMPQQAAYPPMNQATYPGMPQQGMPQQGMPQPGMPQQGMPQPGMPQQGMPQQGAYPGMPQQGAYPQQPMGQQPGYPAMPATGQQPGYPAMPATGFPPNEQMGRPTLIPPPNFDASNDCAKLRKAMKGFGTDNDALIEVICRRTNAQRFDINRTFKSCYGKDLMSEIRSETSGNFECLLLSCLTPLYEYYCKELYQAMDGAGTDEDVLIEVFCALTNHDIRSICAQYNKCYGKSLEQEMKSETSGSFKRLLVSLSCGNRDESMRIDINSAKADAQELKNAGVGRWGTDESAFNRILCMRNYAQLKLIFKEYESLTGSTLEKDIKKEFSGDIEDGLLAIVRCANNRAEFFARRLHKSMAGLGTNDRALIRLVITRCEHDMVDIKEAFQRLYGKSLKSFIKGDTSGDYKHALYALIGENRS